MKKKVALLVAAAMLSTTVLAGCGGGSKGTDESKGSEQGTTTAAGETAGGLDLAVQIGPDPETLDPALNSAIDGADMIIHGFETLLTFDEENNVVPGQAESFEVSDDGLTYTFHLRDGLKWSDGSDLTAEDFVYSYKRLANPLTAAPYAYDMLCMVKGYDAILNLGEDATEEETLAAVDGLAVSAPDAKTFVVELANPCVYYDKISAFAVLSPVKKDIIEANGDQWAINPETYVGNGALRMKEWVPGSYILYEKNPYYWDAEKVTVNTVKFVLMEDANASYSAYKTGEIMMAKDIPSEEVPSLMGTEDFHIAPIMGTYYISFNLQKAPFDNEKVREALSLAIDRKYIAETVTQGTYSPATNFVGPGISDAAPGSSFEEVTRENNGGDFFNVDNYEADLEKAKQLLAEAGYPDGQGFPTVEYMTNDAKYHKPIAEYLQSAWKELGINTDIKIVEWSTFTPTRRNGDFEIARNGWVYDYDDPSNMINLLETNNGNNDGKYSNPEFDALVEKARTTADKEEHYKLLHEAENMLLEDTAMAPVAYENDFWVQSPKLKGTWHSPYGYWYFMYATVEE